MKKFAIIILVFALVGLLVFALLSRGLAGPIPQGTSAPHRADSLEAVVDAIVTRGLCDRFLNDDPEVRAIAFAEACQYSGGLPKNGPEALVSAILAGFATPPALSQAQAEQIFRNNATELRPVSIRALEHLESNAEIQACNGEWLKPDAEDIAMLRSLLESSMLYRSDIPR